MLKRNIKRTKERFNIQDGKITYSDLNKPGKPFFSKRYRLVGKPDYIIKRDNKFIPVEIKSSHHDKPQQNHILQLAAYCHLIEENYGGFVPYGILVYENISKFRIPYDPKNRYELELNIKNIRQAIKKKKIIRNHNNPSKCKNCSMKIYCNKRLL